MKKELVLEEIYRQNKHWENAADFLLEIDRFSFKRTVFAQLWRFIESRQILSLVGLRRVGKTVLLRQLIKELLPAVNSKDIFFLTFDEALIVKGAGFADYLNVYLEKIADRKNKIFIFIDEIQYVPKWQHILKRYYDTEPNIKFIISGSSSLFIKKRTTESLAGRIYEFALPPLDFVEYLEIKNVDTEVLEGVKKFSVQIGSKITPDQDLEHFFNSYKSRLESHFEDYLAFGQFPEIVNETDIQIRKKYLREAIFRKTIEYDIPRIFGIEKVEELKFLFQVIANETGSVVEIGNLARETELDQKTLKKYLEYFEASFLVFVVYNFSKSFRKSKKSLKKVYLGSPNFYSTFHETPKSGTALAQVGFLAENYCFLLLKKYFEYISFYRVRQAEFDFIAANDLLQTDQFKFIEVKYRNEILNKDYRFIYREARKKSNYFFVISKNELDIKEGCAIIPIWLVR